MNIVDSKLMTLRYGGTFKESNLIWNSLYSIEQINIIDSKLITLRYDVTFIKCYCLHRNQ